MTDEPMSLDRFRRLAEAYGGSIARWPEAERGAATRLMHEPGAVTTLKEALALDVRLDGWRVPAPGEVLRARVIVAAPMPRRSWPEQARLWWSGLGLAAALAGAAAGSLAAAAVSPVATAAGNPTAFGDLGDGGAL